MIRLFIISCIFALQFCTDYTLQAQEIKLDSFEKVLQKQKNDSSRVELLTSTCFKLCKTNPSLTIHLAKKAIELTKKYPKLKFECEIYRVMGITYTGIGRYDSAHYYLAEGIKAAHALKLRGSEARCLNSLGNLYDYESKPKESLDAYLKSLSIREEMHDTASIIIMLNNIGLFHSENGNYEKSLEYLSKAKFMAEKNNDTTNLALAFGNFSEVYQNLKQFEKAKQCELQSLALMRKLNDNHGIRISLNSLGLICSALKEYKKAKTYFEECLPMAEKAHDRDLITEIYYGLAKVEGGLQNWTEEVRYGKLCEEKAQEIHSKDGLLKAYEVIYKGNEALGNYKEALTYHKLLKQTSDSLFSAEKSAKVMEMQTKYEVEKKENENRLLKKEKDLKDLRIRQQTWIIISSLIIICLVVFLSIMLFKSQYKEKGVNLILAEQKLELQAKNHLLEELNEIKDRLFSIISHDLRVPLNSLKSLLTLLNDKTLSEEQVQKTFPKLIQEVNYTSNLLDSLLSWAKSQLQGIHTNPQKIRLNALTQENIELLGSMAAQKNIQLIDAISAETFVMADEDMTRTILRNLISNAIKFTPENGIIRITAQTFSKEVKIYVEDTGIGISQEVLAQLFTGNITRRGTNNEKGTGLGLVLVKDFVEKNKGNIQVESVEGKGSTFVVTLPSCLT